MARTSDCAAAIPEEKMKAKELPAKKRDALLKTLQARFEANMDRHSGVTWSDVEARLDANKLWSLNEMEGTGGEPDVVVLAKKSREIVFVDCSTQSPKDRRSVCYDDAALKARKEHKPKDSAMAMASRWGVELLTEEQYRALQTLGEFDTTTSSWVQTPAEIRKRGGALFCDRRYDTVFLYHNGADSYYGARGFRCALKV